KIANGEAIDLTKAAYNLPEKIKAKSKTKDEEKIQYLAEVFASKTDEIYKLLGKKAFYEAFLQNITPLSLLREIHQEMRKIQREQNLLSIAEFNKIIHDELKKQPAPFIYERLGEKYRHFFIDEFQDTSVMQWQNLIPLIDNATSSEELSGERGTVMLVGDPKQSIYRWRGGKAEQFIELGKNDPPFNNKDRKVFQLETNWRSHSQVIDFNNAFFIFTANRFEHEDYQSLYSKSAQLTNYKKEGFVRLEFVEQNEEDEKNQPFLDAVWNTLQEVRAQGFTNGEIAVLTRRREQGIAVASMLTGKGIPIISSETLLIGSSQEVRFLIDFLKFLFNPKDLDSKANLLYYIARSWNLPVHEFIEGGVRLKDADLQIWFSDHQIESALSSLRKKSLYEAVESLLHDFIPAEGQNAYVQHFLDIVLERETKTNSGLAEFLEFWSNSGHQFSVPTPFTDDAVQIMTVHKSKGLEFPVVIYPFADEEYSRQRKDRLWLDADEEELGLPRILVDNTKAVE